MAEWQPLNFSIVKAYTKKGRKKIPYYYVGIPAGDTAIVANAYSASFLDRDLLVMYIKDYAAALKRPDIDLGG